jgi:leucyl aminopeptidase
MPDIAFVKPALPRTGALVLPVPEGGLTGLAAEADRATDGALSRALEAAGFKGRKGQATTLWALGPFGRIVALGLGPADALTPEAVEAVGGTAITNLSQEREATVLADGLTGALAASLGMGAKLRAWRFDRYRTTEKEDDKPKLERLAIATTEATAAKQAFAPMSAVADGVFLTRDLVSEPPNVLHPIEFAERCRALEKLGVEVEVMGLKELRKLGFGAMIGVAMGSQHEPRMVVMQWKGAPKTKKAAQKPIAFIGKGVTFDTGGISIKPAGGMEDMKWDMAGAGTVVGLMAALAGRRAKCDVVGLVGIVENMPSGTAQRPGDVVTSYSGQTIEVINTDAEGRLVLADVIWYAQERFAPRCMIDLATLTGAIIIALGHEHAGLFSNDDELAARIQAAGAAVGEKAWRMPLGDAYDKQIKSDIADMKNVGGRPGGSITAAQFIQRFVDTRRGPMPWAHLDIAGTAWSSKDQPTIPKGATAYGVRMLDRLVAEMGEG